MRLWLLSLATLAWAGCATDYVSRTQEVRQAYEANDHQGALAKLEEERQRERDRDKLLVLMDLGMVLHADGQYAKSNEALEEAERLADQLDVVSVSEETATLLTNDRRRAYRGEDYERLMLNVLKALNYAALGDDESALVEVRRMNERLRVMIAEEKKPYQQLAVARYLGGALWEEQGNWDSAFIDYWAAYQQQPDLGHLAGPILRTARRAGRDEQYAQLEAAFPTVDGSPLAAGEGEVLVVVEAGLSPQKEGIRQSNPDGGANLIAVPVFKDRGRPAQAQLTVPGDESTARATAAQSLPTVTVTSVRDVAHLHLNDRVGRYLAKSLAATAAKAGVAAGAGALTKSPEVGFLTFYLLALSNQADLRSWLSLPAEFQLARVKLPAGRHELRIDSRGHASTHPVEVESGRLTVLVVRRY